MQDKVFDDRAGTTIAGMQALHHLVVLKLELSKKSKTFGVQVNICSHLHVSSDDRKSVIANARVGKK